MKRSRHIAAKVGLVLVVIASLAAFKAPIMDASERLSYALPRMMHNNSDYLIEHAKSKLSQPLFDIGLGLYIIIGLLVLAFEMFTKASLGRDSYGGRA